jgi:hypothetical protein
MGLWGVELCDDGSLKYLLDFRMMYFPTRP